MNDRISVNVLGILALILGAVAGCQTPPVGRTSKAAVRIEVVPSPAICVRGVEVYEAAEGLVIRGKVRRAPDNCCDTTRGAVAILLVSPDGTVVDATNTSWTPRNIPKGLTRASTFTATLSYVPAEDFRLRIACSPE